MNKGKIENYKFEKSTCERYDIKVTDGFGWAIITLDENGGVFNAQSDYGSYSYRWPYHGRKSFKHFVLELVRDSSYFLNKVAKDDYFYEEETIRAFKKKIIEERKEDNLSKEDARSIWNELIGFDYNSCDGLCQQMYNSRLLNKLYPEFWYSFEPVKGFSPDAKAFCEVILPILGEIIKDEINEETNKSRN